MNVIDEFVVQIGIDPSKFTAGQKKVLDDFKKTQDAALRGAKQVESSVGAVGDSIQKVTSRALGLLSILVGGVGMKQFAQEQTKAADETGRTAKLIETSTGILSKWMGVAQLAGSSAGAMRTSLSNLSTEFSKFKITGESSLVPFFNALNIDLNKIKDIDDLMATLAERFGKLSQADARYFGQQFGFDDAFITALKLGPESLARMADEAKKLGTFTDEDAAAARRVSQAWAGVEIAVTRLFDKILAKGEPILTRVFSGYAKFFSGRGGNEGSILGRLFSSQSKESGAEPSEVWTGGGVTTPAIRTKTGAGQTSLATAALANSLQSEIPGIDRFTAFNDTYHQLLGRGSAHTRGQALDFTLKNPGESAAVAEAIRKKLAGIGVDASVLDEYQNPSRGSTGGHIHVQFSSAAAAARYADVAQAGRVGGAGGGSRTSSVNIGKVEIHTSETTADGIAATIKPAIERSTLVSQAQAGPQ